MFLQSVQPTAWDLKFRLFGIDTRVHPGFWLGGIIFAQQSAEAWELFAGVATLFISILVHEYGHALCGRYYGDRVPSVTLHMMGGYYMPGTIHLRHGQSIWLSLWGPLAGFFLGGAALGVQIAMAMKIIPDNKPLAMITFDFVWICMVWGVVNLFPIFPLDGGQIFREVVRWKFPSKDDAFCYKFSMIVAVIVALLMVWLTVKIGLSGIAVLLFLSLAFQNYQFYKIEKLNGGFDGIEEDKSPRQPWERDGDWWKKQ